MQGFGEGIGSAMVFLAGAAALSAPVALLSIPAVPLMLFGYTKTAATLWGLGAVAGVAGLAFVVRESR